MKAIMISIKPKWCALMMNGDKTIEVRTSEALAKAIQKLIDEYGYAEIYVYCSKNGGNLVYGTDYRGGSFVDEYGITRGYSKQQANEIFGLLNGKVIFKFRCYKVEELKTCDRHSSELLDQSCLNADEFYDYLTKGKNFLGQVLGCAIHISDLEIFDKPKELSEFKHWVLYKKCYKCPYGKCDNDYGLCSQCCEIKPLTKAPQSWCYVEGESYEK